MPKSTSTFFTVHHREGYSEDGVIMTNPMRVLKPGIRRENPDSESRTAGSPRSQSEET